jgi:glycosyltransferase involved in cell wall biosynthesis
MTAIRADHAPGAGQGSGEPAVSVIMIFWNAAPYLEEAICSVRGQSLEDWELLLVDDGSTDGGPAIASAHAAEDARIRVLAHEGGGNRGTGESRNLGLRAARGEFIAFLDADDVFEPDRLAVAIERLRHFEEVGTVVTFERYWREWADADPRLRMPEPDRVIGPSVPARTVIAPGLLLYTALAVRGAATPGICSVTFRRSLLDRTGLIPAHFIDQYEDQVLIALLLLEAPAFVEPTCLSRYRQHARSLTAVVKESGEYRPGRPHAARDRYLDWLEAHLKARDAWTGAWAAAIAAERSPPGAAARPPRWRTLARRVLVAAATLAPAPLTRGAVRGLWHWQQRRVERRAAGARRRFQLAAELDATAHVEGGTRP